MDKITEIFSQTYKALRDFLTFKIAIGRRETISLRI